MIVVSSAMGKSGSTFFCNLQEDMLALSGTRSGQKKLREKFNGRFIRRITFPVFLQLIYINCRFGSVVVKTHSPPTRYVRWLISFGIAKATYSYRDVRDVILSSLDHGRRNRDRGDLDAVYADMFAVEDALQVGKDSIIEFNRWHTYSRVHLIRYESLMLDRLKVLEDVCEYLGWNISTDELVTMIDKHEGIKKGALNFNKGIVNRYQEEMTDEEQFLCNHLFKDYLIEMNYVD